MDHVSSSYLYRGWTKTSCLDDLCVQARSGCIHVMFTARFIVLVSARVYYILLVSAYVYIGNSRLLYAKWVINSFLSAGGQQRGDLRFRGSFSDGTSGRLEVFSNNQWGTICIDGFTKLSADTACRQLGSVEALTFGEAERLGYV